MKSVYLAGPITGLDFNGCTDWRKLAVAELADAGIKGLSPMRGKDYLDGLGILDGVGTKYAHLGVMSNPRGVMTRDRFDATRCDALLVNLLGAKIPSIGTIMEIAWADLCRTPIICAMEAEGNPHEHMMIHEALGYRVTTLEEAIDIAKVMLA